MLRWQRIEAGYYALTGTPYSIANMHGVVKYRGTCPKWEVRREGKVVTEAWTAKEAKQIAYRLYTQESLT